MPFSTSFFYSLLFLLLLLLSLCVMFLKFYLIFWLSTLMQYSDSIARFLQNEELHISKKEVAQIKTLESKGKGKNKKKVPGKGKNKKKVTGKGKKVPHSHVLIGEKVMMRLIKEEVEDIDLGKYYRAMDKLEKEEVRKKAKKAAQKAKRGALMWDIGMKELKNT